MVWGPLVVKFDRFQQVLLLCVLAAINIFYWFWEVHYIIYSCFKCYRRAVVSFTSISKKGMREGRHFKGVHWVVEEPAEKPHLHSPTPHPTMIRSLVISIVATVLVPTGQTLIACPLEILVSSTRTYHFIKRILEIIVHHPST